MNFSSEVTVVGGGIIGCAVAYNLARQGMEVTLVERSGFAAEASGANLGLLVTVTDEPGSTKWDLSLESTRLYPGLSEELGADIEYRRSGSLMVYKTPEALEKGRKLAARQRAAGLEVSLIGPKEMLDLEPNLPSSLAGAAYCPSDGQVNALRLTLAYARAARNRGARLLSPATVTGIEVRGGCVTAVETNQGRIATRTVVNAAGAWAGQVGRFVGLEIPVVPCRGQVMVLGRGSRHLRTVIAGLEPYVLRTATGTLLVGSSTEYAEYEKGPNLEILTRLARNVRSAYPSLADTRVIRMWAGLRPSTADNIPFLGRVAGVGGFVLATGHFRSGVQCGPATGEVIAQLVAGQPTTVSLTRCGLNRLSAR